jgi:type II secretory pathway component PulF
MASIALTFVPAGERIKDSLDRMAFSWAVREDFYRHMSGQIRNEISQIAALERFEKRLRRRKKSSSAEIIRDVIRRMKNGSQLAVALQKWVPSDEALILLGGENAGQVSDAFDLIIDSKLRVRTVRRTLISALITPTVYLVALYGLVWAVGEYVLPTVSMVVPASQATGTAKLLFTLGDAATSPWVLLPIGVLGAILGWISWSLPNWTHPLRVKAEDFFPYSFYRDIQGFIWILTFAAMLKAGMSDTKILDDQTRYASPWLRQRLVAVRRRMLNGDSLAKALIGTRYGFPNPDMIDDIESMSDFTDFPERIAVRVRQWADELQYKTTKNVKVMGFAFDILMYALILVVLVGINGIGSAMGTIPN